MRVCVDVDRPDDHGRCLLSVPRGPNGSGPRGTTSRANRPRRYLESFPCKHSGTRNMGGTPGLAQNPHVLDLILRDVDAPQRGTICGRSIGGAMRGGDGTPTPPACPR